MKKIDQIELDQIYWTCEPVSESAGYGETGVRPWRGKVSHICLNYDKIKRNGNFKLSYFDSETGKCDLDSNATAYCRPDNIFDSEKEAWEYYYSYILQKESEIIDEIKFSIEKLKSLQIQKK